MAGENEFKNLAEKILQNTEALRAEVEAVKGQVDPLSKDKLDRINTEFAELKGKVEKLANQPVGGEGLPMSTKGAGGLQSIVIPAGSNLEEVLARMNLVREDGPRGRKNRPYRVRDDRTPEQKAAQTKAFEKMLRYGYTGPTSHQANWTAEDVKALSSITDSQGGYQIPADFEAELIKTVHDEAEVRGVIQVRPTSRDKVQIPKRTSQISVTWGGESIAVDPQNQNYGLEEIPINEQTALILVPNSTLEDSAVDIMADLTEESGMAFAEDEDDQFTVGNGINKPQGFMAWADILSRYVAGGHASALNSPDALIKALYKLKKTYRRNATWAMNSTTEGVVRQLKDGNGQYLWQLNPAGLAAGSPTLLSGRPIINPEGMADIAANAYPIVVADFRRGYKGRDRKGLSIQRLIERYAEFRQTGFLITRRLGGQPVQAEAYVPVKIAAS